MRGGAKIALVGGVFAAMVGTAGYGAYNLFNGITGGVTSAVPQAAPVKTGEPTPDEIRDTAKAFLAAWAKGDTTEAAGLTDDESAASEALTGYTETAYVTKVALTPGTAGGAEVPFSVKAVVSYKDASSSGTKDWAYDSSLTVVRSSATGAAVVHWQPSVVHPKLTAGASLVTGEAPTPQVEITDRNGTKLDASDYPSLSGILTELRTRYAGKLDGTPGIETYVEEPDDTAGETLLTLSEGKPAELATTLDADIQAAAEKAVKQRENASVVAVKPSTGGILAVANNTSDGANNAFMAQLAPGSTFKVITSATLMEHAGITPGKSVPCEKFQNYEQGQMFHNVDSGSDPSATFAQDFARSCNTAFVSLAGEIGDSALSDEATEVFGLNTTWSIGVPSFDGLAPSGSGDEKAAQMIGQGTIQMSPLNMASVAATAKTGEFTQPRLVDAKLIGGDLATTGRPLGASTARNLRDMMRLTATSGTAATAMSGLGGDKGGKTGSAEVGGQTAPNGWFLAFRDDVAASAVVIEGGHGGDSAGPIVASVLAAKRG